mmetsp:Transcript_9398/g.19201  ORF Transcript_9398/g.19201 Transcript_9398/m.19201 type:complete len:105 (-) Transcript_9398:557-871(-)
MLRRPRGKPWRTGDTTADVLYACTEVRGVGSMGAGPENITSSSVGHHRLRRLDVLFGLFASPHNLLGDANELVCRKQEDRPPAGRGTTSGASSPRLYLLLTYLL